MEYPISFYNNFTLLAQLYRVDISTFMKWISPIRHQLKKDFPRVILLRREIERILTYLGEPGSICGYDYFEVRTFKSLAIKYENHKRTMSVWTKNLPIKYENEKRRILTPREVEMIMDHLAPP